MRYRCCIIGGERGGVGRIEDPLHLTDQVSRKEEKKRILECCVLRVCVDAGEYLFVPPTTKKLHIEQFDRGYRIGRMR